MLGARRRSSLLPALPAGVACGRLLQRKASIGAPDDALETEADATAERVLRMGEATSIRATTPTLQRKCSACEDDERKPIQAKRAASAANTGALDTAAASAAAARGGAPLSHAVRAYFEPRFGHDFSLVRVHTDADAAHAAQSIQARAYTIGRNIVFGAGEYAPDSGAGRRLIAHELTHVLQQRGGAAATVQRDSKPAPPPPSAIDTMVAGMPLSDADKTAFAKMVAKGSVPLLPNAVDLTGTEAFDTPVLGEYFFCQAMQSKPIKPFDNFCAFSGTVVGTPLFEAYRAKVIKPEYAKTPAKTLGTLAMAHRTVGEMKSMLATCDGGLGIWDKAKKANGGREPAVGFGKTDSGGFTSGGSITLDEKSDRCTAMQVLIQELSNMSRAKDFDKSDSEALAGNVAREDYIRATEKIEYESGVKNVLTAFDACKSTWKCATAEKEWARAASGFDQYYSDPKFLDPAHKEGYGKWWDTNCKTKYEAKHRTK